MVTRQTCPPNLFPVKNFVLAPQQNIACPTDVIQAGVNDAVGLPVMMVTGELTEKLQYAIEQYIIPQLQYGVLKNSYGVTKPTLDNTVCQIYHDNHMHSVHIFSGKKNNIKQNEKRIKHVQSGEIPNEEPCQNTETDKRNKAKSETARQSTTGTGKILFL